ncbi:MAG: heavy metal sensor histidine kinase [Sulfuricella denitrificans]|nr:heavy metal sensor histidine kinase [Sulfuricella denitrificans]
MSWRKSITLRLTLLFAAASAMVLFAVGTVIGLAVEAHFEEQDRMELNGKLELIRHALLQVRVQADLDALPQHLDDALVGHHDLSVVVVTPANQKLFATSGADFPAPLLDERPASGKIGPGKLKTWEHGDQAYRGITVVIPTGMPGAAPFKVAVALNIGHHLAFMSAFQRILWGAVTLGILLTGLLGWGVTRREMAPVRNIAEVAKGMSAQQLHKRLPIESVPAELEDLASSFNEMLSRLEDSFRRLSEFSSDLAHELRTPISNLMTQTQVTISKARTADEYQDILYSNLEEYERLARMISDMLFLAKADNGLIIPRSEQVDLVAEVQALFEYYEAIAEEGGVTLALTGEGAIPGDKLMIRRAISNLLSNAIRYTPRGGSVKVNITRPGSGEIHLIVENTGATIPVEHLPRLFDRFYRVDPSRQKTAEGAGLGLAITKSILVAHHGAITASSSQGITRFLATFHTTPNAST